VGMNLLNTIASNTYRSGERISAEPTPNFLGGLVGGAITHATTLLWQNDTRAENLHKLHVSLAPWCRNERLELVFVPFLWRFGIINLKNPTDSLLSMAVR
jgi:hypothetical protein